MVDRHGIAQNGYILLTSLALISGLFMLSTAGKPHTLLGSSSQNYSSIDLESQNLSIPEDSPIQPDDIIDHETLQETDIAQNEDLVTTLGEELVDMVGGTDSKLPTGTNASAAQLADQFEDGELDSSDLAGLDSETLEQVAGNMSDKDFDDLLGSMEQGGMNATQDSQTERGNNTAGSAGTDDQGGRETTDGNTTNTGEDGKPKQDGDNRTGNQTDESSSDKIDQQERTGNPEEDTVTEEKQEEQNTAQSDPTTVSSTITDSLTPKTISIILVATLLCVTGYLFYRSDKDLIPFLYDLYRTVRDAIISIPRVINNAFLATVSRTAEAVQRLLQFIGDLVTAPITTLQRIATTISSAASQLRDGIRQLTSLSFSDILGLMTGQPHNRDGIDRAWYRLKDQLDLTEEHAITPTEVRSRAISEGLPSKTVSQIVDAFQKEKYTADGYNGELRLATWQQDLEAQTDG